MALKSDFNPESEDYKIFTKFQSEYKDKKNV